MSQKMIKIPERRRNGRRQTDKKNQKTKISASVKAQVFARDKGQCFCCGSSLNGNASYDHFIPRSSGGTNDPENIFTCCASTNNFFGNKSAAEKMRLILNSPHRKFPCSKISKIIKQPTEQQ
jgi:5-methylcytosine-specific restriction endonuclease McrA